MTASNAMVGLKWVMVERTQVTGRGGAELVRCLTDEMI
jgi:hypothetical protein